MTLVCRGGCSGLVFGWAAVLARGPWLCWLEWLDPLDTDTVVMANNCFEEVLTCLLLQVWLLSRRPSSAARQRPRARLLEVAAS